MDSGKPPGSLNDFEGYGFQHELDDYIKSFAEEDHFGLFFDDAYYNGLGENEYSALSLTNEYTQLIPDVPDSLIDPLLRAEPNVPPDDEEPRILLPAVATNIVAAPGLRRAHIPQDHAGFHTQTPASSSTPRKLRRRSKKDESTHNHTPEAKYPLYDPRLYELAKHHSTPFKCLPSLPNQGTIYNALPDVGGFGEVSPPQEISQAAIDGFLASLNLTSFDHSIGDIMMTDSPPRVVAQQAPTSVINKQDFTMRMLAPSAPLVQPSEKRKRGRPKKDEVDESHQEVPAPLVQSSFSFRAQQQLYMHPTGFPQPQNTPMLHFPAPQFLPQAPIAPTMPILNSSRSTPHLGSEADDEAPAALSKRRKVDSRAPHRSMSKKEQAYLEMDNKVKLYDENNINELLYFPTLKPGRTPCFWIQRHPYANTRVYEDHYRTWCRYRNCKGVETTELIRTSTGEMREKNYKHPRTIIAGNYQVAVDWEYVADEIQAFKNNPEGQYEYDKRNVFDTVECFFHLRCFEQLVDFPQVVRTHLVQIDHRVLNKDKSRNKITKRKNKGGTNAAEIEWYLKDDAEHWMQRTQLDWSFNPPPWSDESLEKVLLTGKKQYNDKKGTKYMLHPGSEFGSPVPSEL
ncbi:hypothetical protein TWF481_000175 [Arthrobotrys musiformis]|uniref:Uncharacterized protein n=1 Tax=Arthrobotrys musiformis TaxID=47236 RepID=A0AAV9WMX5_9PEZI